MRLLNLIKRGVPFFIVVLILFAPEGQGATVTVNFIYDFSVGQDIYVVLLVGEESGKYTREVRAATITQVSESMYQAIFSFYLKPDLTTYHYYCLVASNGHTLSGCSNEMYGLYDKPGVIVPLPSNPNFKGVYDYAPGVKEVPPPQNLRVDL